MFTRPFESQVQQRSSPEAQFHLAAQEASITMAHTQTNRVSDTPLFRNSPFCRLPKAPCLAGFERSPHWSSLLVKLLHF